MLCYRAITSTLLERAFQSCGRCGQGSAKVALHCESRTSVPKAGVGRRKGSNRPKQRCDHGQRCPASHQNTTGSGAEQARPQPVVCGQAIEPCSNPDSVTYRSVCDSIQCGVAAEALSLLGNPWEGWRQRARALLGAVSKAGPGQSCFLLPCPHRPARVAPPCSRRGAPQLVELSFLPFPIQTPCCCPGTPNRP